MKTLEGPTIPVLMVKKGYTVNDILTFNGYAIPEKYWGRWYASPELTQEWFDATDEELYRFMNGELSLGPTIMRAGRNLTLPYSKGNIRVSIAPGAKEISEWSGLFQLRNNDMETPPWGAAYNQGVLFYGGPFDKPANPNKINFMYLDMGDPDFAISPHAYRVNRDEFSLSLRYYYIQTPVLIRDTNGDGGVIGFALSTFTNQPSVEKKVLATVAIYQSSDQLTIPLVQGKMSPDFWREQKEEPKKECVGKVNLKDRFEPRVATSGLGIYKLTKEQLTKFMFDLWTNTFAENIIKGINGEATDNILSLKWYYGIGKAIDVIPTDLYLTLGNVAFNGAWNESGPIVVKGAKKAFVQFSLGEVEVKRFYNNFLDYSPFTEMEIYLPFYGSYKLNINELINKRLAVDYYINISTGVTVINITTSADGECYRPVATLQTTMGVDIPVRIRAMDSLLSRVMGIASSTLTQVAAGAGGGLFGAVGTLATSAATRTLAGVAGGAIQNTENQIQPLFNSGETIRQFGGLNDETGSLGYFKSFITYIRPVSKAPDDYNTMVGKPDFKSGKISEFSGYIKVGAINNYSANIPYEAMTEIESLLKGGVYV